ncbi:MAG: hypothetical protein QXH37_00570 [Candidatus Bathyarchaeia archaeon]
MISRASRRKILAVWQLYIQRQRAGVRLIETLNPYTGSWKTRVLLCKVYRVAGVVPFVQFLVSDKTL